MTSFPDGSRIDVTVSSPSILRKGPWRTKGARRTRDVISLDPFGGRGPAFHSRSRSSPNQMSQAGVLGAWVIDVNSVTVSVPFVTVWAVGATDATLAVPPGLHREDVRPALH